MKQELDVLFPFLEGQGIVVSDQQVDQLSGYLKELVLWSKKMSLISSNDQAHIVERHLLTSFLYVHQLLGDNVFSEEKILDLGTGAGLPGIILSIYFKDQPVYLLDSSRKKTLFLKHVVKQLGLNAVVVVDRIENLSLLSEEKFPAVVARAVAAVGKLVQMVRPVVKPGGKLYSVKGFDYKNEYTPDEVAGVRIEQKVFPDVWLKQSDYIKNKLMLKMEF